MGSRGRRRQRRSDEGKAKHNRRLVRLERLEHRLAVAAEAEAAEAEQQAATGTDGARLIGPLSVYHDHEGPEDDCVGLDWIGLD